MSADLSLYQHTAAQFANLCAVAGFEEADHVHPDLLRKLLGPAGHRPVADPPLWPSDVADDCTPVEFSIAFDEGGGSAVRILGETIAESPGLAANAAAARSFLDVLSTRFNLSLDRFAAVEDLFLPENPLGLFTLWYSLIFRPGSSTPTVKVYFNPAVRGEREANGLAAEALRRLGMEDAYSAVAEHALRRKEHDRFAFFALDLDNRTSSRVKVYIAHGAAESHDVEHAATLVDKADPLRVREFCALLGGETTRFTGRPLISAYSFIESDRGRPGNYGLYLPIRDYVRDDAEAFARLTEVMRLQHLDPADAHSAIRAVSKRPLADGVGLLAHVSLRLGSFGSGTTVYLSSEAYEVTPPRRRPAHRPVTGTTAAVSSENHSAHYPSH